MSKPLTGRKGGFRFNPDHLAYRKHATPHEKQLLTDICAQIEATERTMKALREARRTLTYRIRSRARGRERKADLLWQKQFARSAPDTASAGAEIAPFVPAPCVIGPGK